MRITESKTKQTRGRERSHALNDLFQALELYKLVSSLPQDDLAIEAARVVAQSEVFDATGKLRRLATVARAQLPSKRR